MDKQRLEVVPGQAVQRCRVVGSTLAGSERGRVREGLNLAVIGGMGGRRDCSDSASCPLFQPLRADQQPQENNGIAAQFYALTGAPLVRARSSATSTELAMTGRPPKNTRSQSLYMEAH